MKRIDIRQWILYTLSAIFLGLLIQACANIGTPDGGAYDETPPKFISSSPKMFALNNKEKKIVLQFDENIKLEKASEKVVISPAQMEQPDIKSSGKKITVSLVDSLKKNTTYTIDFADAITDNNEGNPLGNFSYTFSTGGEIDTMEVSGTVLDASNLEPVKGILVGLYSNENDSAFTKLPMERISHTDSRGHFVIKGVKKGSYRIYALSDANQNYKFDQKAEMIAFQEGNITTSCEPAVRQDTTWHDSLRYDTIKDINYTRFLPDDIVLRAFKEEQDRQYIVKNERIDLNKITFYFAAKNDSLPVMKGLNFNADKAYVLEKTDRNDTLTYWFKDSTVFNKDTLNFTYRHLQTDPIGKLTEKTDTFFLAAKNNRAKVLKEAAKKRDEFEKEQKKKQKKGDTTRVEMPHEFLPMKINIPSGMAPDQNISFDFEEPLTSYIDTAIHLKVKVDSTNWKDCPFIFRLKRGKIRNFELLAEWRPEQEYKLTVDSAAFIGLYGKESKSEEQSIKMKSLNEFASLFMRISSPKEHLVVQLLDTSDKMVKEVKAQEGKADFYYLNPGKYYVRMFEDDNNNGIWDTGNYALKKQAEKVYYYPGMFEMKALWDIEQSWNPETTSLDKQKPGAITKQKPETEKKIRNRNAERKMGKKPNNK